MQGAGMFYYKNLGGLLHEVIGFPFACLSVYGLLVAPRWITPDQLDDGMFPGLAQLIFGYTRASR
jgi:hypothetical protein